MVLEATLQQGEILKKLVGAIQELVQECNIDATAEGLSLQAMDSSHVSLVSLLLRAEGFEEFQCDKPLSLGFNLQSLAKILKCSGGKDEISIRTEDGQDSCTFVFENPEEDRISQFDLKLMDLDSEHLGIPDSAYKSVVRMPASEFQRICRDMATIGDTILISTTKEGVKFSVSGDIGSGEMTLRNTKDSAMDKSDSDSVLIELEEPVSQSFALRYLNMFTKSTPLSKTVTISMSPDVPLVIEYPIENLGYIRFYLAPKIEED